MALFALRVFALLIALAPVAWASNVALLLSDTKGPYAEFATTLNDALADSSWKISQSGKPGEFSLNEKPPDLIITAGAEALRHALNENRTTPLVATLLPRQSYEKILAEAGKGRGRVTAIYLDQPASRQASFLRRILPGANLQVGILASNETRAQLPQHNQALRQAGMVPQSEDSDTDTTLLPALNALLPRVAVLLALPDSTIYKRENIKTILVTTYRYQRPVIGFSVAFVNAGALAALHSTPSQIARQTADLLISSGTVLPPPMPPSQFAIAINSTVAQALGLTLPDEASIRRAMIADKESR